uniref:Uncharacterized protein n=1 Tax=Triticum urartu TaxID=4572 RepID=A0A8R7U1T6_TRIUA
MEGKVILVCLMVLVQLGNFIDDHCEMRTILSSPKCTGSTCQTACQKIWGPDVKRAECRVVDHHKYCDCIICY